MAKRTLPEPEPRACQKCGRVFTPRRKSPERKFCSVECQRAKYLNHSTEHTSRIAKEPARRRGDALRGTGKSDGYVKRNNRHEHRVVMEEKLGRPLRLGEIVHHKDEDKKNNDPSNLDLYESQAEHARLHSTRNRKCEIQGCSRKHNARGMCKYHYNRWLTKGR